MHSPTHYSYSILVKNWVPWRRGGIILRCPRLPLSLALLLGVALVFSPPPTSLSLSPPLLSASPPPPGGPGTVSCRRALPRLRQVGSKGADWARTPADWARVVSTERRKQKTGRETITETGLVLGEDTPFLIKVPEPASTERLRRNLASSGTPLGRFFDFASRWFPVRAPATPRREVRGGRAPAPGACRVHALQLRTDGKNGV